MSGLMLHPRLTLPILIGSVAMLTALFVASVERANRHFARAAASQAQLVDVLLIRHAALTGDGTAVAAALRRYRDDIARETRLLGSEDAAAQRGEIAEVGRMTALASATPFRPAVLARLVEAAAAREREEAAAAGQAMAALRTSGRLYALLLASVAALAALASGVLAATTRRRLTRAVARRTAQLEAVDASRRLFFAKVSHELRTPVTVMRGEAEVALATADDDARTLADALREVVTQSEQLDHRVAELLGLSQAQDGRPTLELVPLDVAGVIQSALENTRRLAASYGVSLVRTGARTGRVRGDARWLEQALVAVLDNAVKFSPPGGAVEVDLAVANDAAEVTVADRGQGVPAEELPRLFDAYYQAGGGRARGGSGLGLALVRWIAEQHGGSARALPRSGGGCAVAIALPLAS